MAEIISSKSSLIISGAPTTNYGSINPTQVGIDNNQGKTLIEFDLSVCPSVSKALLRIYGTAIACTIRIYRITASWVENSVTWDTVPSTSDFVDIAQGGVGSAAYIYYNITTFVKNWKSGLWANYGILMVNPTTPTTAGLDFQSDDSATAAQRPTLIVTPISGGFLFF